MCDESSTTDKRSQVTAEELREWATAIRKNATAELTASPPRIGTGSYLADVADAFDYAASALKARDAELVRLNGLIDAMRREAIEALRLTHDEVAVFERGYRAGFDAMGRAGVMIGESRKDERIRELKAETERLILAGDRLEAEFEETKARAVPAGYGCVCWAQSEIGQDWMTLAEAQEAAARAAAEEVRDGTE